MASGHLPSPQKRASTPTITQAAVRSASGRNHAAGGLGRLSALTVWSAYGRLSWGTCWASAFRAITEGKTFAGSACRRRQSGARILDDLGSLVVLYVAGMREDDQLGEQPEREQLKTQDYDKRREQQGRAVGQALVE